MSAKTLTKCLIAIVTLFLLHGFFVTLRTQEIGSYIQANHGIVSSQIISLLCDRLSQLEDFLYSTFVMITVVAWPFLFNSRKSKGERLEAVRKIKMIKKRGDFEKSSI